MSALVLFAALAAQAPPPTLGPELGEHQRVAAVRVLAEGRPMAERRPDKINAFYAQGLVLQSGVTFDIPAAATAALRERYRLSSNDFFRLDEWVSQAPGRPSRHRLPLLRRPYPLVPRPLRYLLSRLRR